MVRDKKSSGEGKRPDLERMGLFSEATYISSGEPFRQKNDTSLVNRIKGKQFLTTPTKKGHTNKDSFFEKEFSRIFENEALNDIVAIRRQWREEEKAKIISQNPFRPTNVTPKPSGKGSLFGTIEQQWPVRSAEIDINSFPEKEIEKVEEHRPNILTRPPKKGSGYGYPNVTIGQPFEHMTDPYDVGRLKEQEELKEHKARVISQRPFISASHRLDFFNSFAALLADKERARNFAAARAKKKEADGNLKPPFKPTSRLGETINKYPKQEPVPNRGRKGDDDDDEKQKRKSILPVFKPSGVLKSYPVRSIIEATCPIVPPAWIQESMIKTTTSYSI